MTALRLGSLFDGIGVFPLAAVRCGIEPVWASEIENAPISITKRHFPDMAHLGDVTKLDGRELPPVHIITFGSPCQNLSQIGNRKGLAGEKSSLFFQAIRIIREMRGATNGLFPAIAVWENVMGAFSSNDRMDFRAVLSVSNECSVLPPEQLQHIFEPFYRPDLAHSQATGGNGLGLYIVQTILDKLRLKYQFVPMPNDRGMSFTIQF